MNIVINEEALRQKCNPVTSLDDMSKIISQVKEMHELMVNSNGCGIAAPQVGINKQIFLAVLSNGSRLELFINPQILDKSKETDEDTEGCLSIPNCYGTVVRHKSIKVKYFNGKEIKTRVFEGLDARIVQHEYDHLEGILYTDKATNIIKEVV